MIVAVDTGGTKTLIASFADDGSLLDHWKFPTPATEAEYVHVLSQELHRHFGNKTVDALVVAMPGIVIDGVAVWCNNLKWKNFNVILENHGLLVYPRPQSNPSELRDHPNLKIVDAPLLDISATFIRKQIKMGKSVKYLIPDSVNEMIGQKKLYL